MAKNNDNFDTVREQCSLALEKESVRKLIMNGFTMPNVRNNFREPLCETFNIKEECYIHTDVLTFAFSVALASRMPGVLPDCLARRLTDPNSPIHSQAPEDSVGHALARELQEVLESHLPGRAVAGILPDALRDAMGMCRDEALCEARDKALEFATNIGEALKHSDNSGKP